MNRIVTKPTRIDLHIHSAASIATKDKGKKELADCGKGHVDVLLRGLEAHGINMCAITDHDCFDKDLYFALKEKEGDGCLSKVFPGVEFSVSIRAGGEEPTVIHIVAIFDDRRPELIDGIARSVCDEHGKPRYDDLDNGAFTEDGFAKVLRDIGLNVVLIGHEKSAGQEAKRDVSSLGADRANEVILTEFVDAVEIRNKRRELDIKRLIEAYPRDAVPFVVGSDCHDWAAYPGTEGGEISFSSLKCLPTFEGLLMAITDLSRIKVGDCSFFSASSSKLDSLRLAVDSKDFDIPLSPGINAIIGDTFIEDPAEREELVSPIIDAAIADADAEIDGYLAKRYAVPLAPAPRVINKFSKDIAVYNLFSRIGIDEGTDQKTYLNRYNAAIKFLTLVAEGTVSIGTETEDPASAAAGGFKVKSNSRLFTREKMRGM